MREEKKPKKKGIKQNEGGKRNEGKLNEGKNTRKWVRKGKKI